MTEIVVGLGDLDKRLRALSSDAAKKQMLGRLGLSVVREGKLIMRAEHTKTGNTSRLITLGVVTPERVTVSAGGAMVFLEEGTKPHIIRPRNAKALRFAKSKSGRRLTGTPRNGAPVVFARFVRHPGTKAYHVMRRAAEKAVATTSLAAAAVDAWNGAA